MRLDRIFAAVALLLSAARLLAGTPAAPLDPGSFADGTLRYSTTRGTIIRSDVFTLPGPSELTVDFKFVTSEFNPLDFNFGQNDYVLFGLFDPAKALATPLPGVDLATRGVLDPNTGLFPIGAPYTSPRGDQYGYESSAIELLLDVPASLAGRQAYVMFGVFDVGDTLGPTAALVNGFSQPIPGAYFSPDLNAFLGSTGGAAGYIDMVPTQTLPAGITLDGFSGTLPLLSTGGQAIPEPGSVGVLVVGAVALLKRRRGSRLQRIE